MRSTVLALATVIAATVGLILSARSGSSTPAISDSCLAESEHPYANSYRNIWTVINPDGQATASRVHFVRLDLEGRADFLVVRDGEDHEIQRFTGSYSDGVWTDPVQGRIVRLELLTDSSVRGWGLCADEVASVPVNWLAQSTHPYANGANQTWTLVNRDTAATASRVYFSRLDLEDRADYVLIRDSLDNVYQWLTGNYPDGLWSAAVPGRIVRIQLLSDASVARWGFAVDQIGTVLGPSPITTPTPRPVLIESSHPYGNNTNQSWLLANPDPETLSTKIHFARMETEGCCDFVYLRDQNDRLMQGLSGSGSDFWGDLVPGPFVKVQFRSDGSSTRWGFRIDDIVPGDLRSVLAESHHPYADNTDERWTIPNPNPEANSTKLHIQRFETEGCCDRLSVRSGNGILQQVISGSAADSWTVDIPGSIVILRFTSDSSSTRWGFRTDDVLDGELLPVLAESDHPYANNTNQTWTLPSSRPDASFTRAHFWRVITEGCCDKLYVQDGRGTTIQTISGSALASGGWSEWVPGVVVKLIFQSDGSYTDWGFRVDGIESQPPGPTATPSPTPYWLPSPTATGVPTPQPTATSSAYPGPDVYLPLVTRNQR